MHSEHEEAMRADFSDRAAISLNALAPRVSGEQVEEIGRRVAEYDQRWESGPHAQEWAFLHAAYNDWRDFPEDMGVFVEDLRANPTVYAEFGPTEVQMRSLDQAHNIARELRCARQAWKSSTQREPIRRDR
ncbi:hypothetical protein ACFXPR_18885 [Nocardia tengchongensis]|uniref:hypothetical protein n=1 Tax=Nocardia tengchongensis TaxID=2055889 RepID=UPI0036950845